MEESLVSTCILMRGSGKNLIVHGYDIKQGSNYWGGGGGEEGGKIPPKTPTSHPKISTIKWKVRIGDIWWGPVSGWRDSLAGSAKHTCSFSLTIVCIIVFVGQHTQWGG